jgi:protein-disulfide isomerase
MTQPTDARRSRRLTLPLVVAVAAALAAAVLFWAGRDDGTDSAGEPAERTASSTESGAAASASPSTPHPAAELERREEGDPRAVGDVDAPVVMLAYSEFQCPFCGRFARETMPELQHYVDDGTLRIEWRDFPYLGPESTLAALGGRAAAEQDMFWELHDAVFEDQPDPNSGTVTEEWLVDKAEEAGLDREVFEAALNSDPAHLESINEEQMEGVTLGVTGTPSFLVNGTPVVGAQPTATFVEAIDRAAAAAG